MSTEIPIESKQIECPRSQLKERILPLLRGKVFHVTGLDSFRSICSDRLIKNSRDHQLSSPWKNSYGPKNGYVCLFDLRKATGEQIDEALLKYYFLSPFHGEKDAHVYLFISDRAWPDLISERKRKELAIPDVEVWYPGDIPLSFVSSALVVTGQFDEKAVQLKEVYRRAYQIAEANQKAKER